jgi:hypothetical protein
MRILARWRRCLIGHDGRPCESDVNGTVMVMNWGCEERQLALWMNNGDNAVSAEQDGESDHMVDELSN